MTVNPLYCSLSVWTGLEGYCRWCDKEIADDNSSRRKWCSGDCLQAWRSQHRYFLARQTAVKLARGRCGCNREDNEPRHVICAHCGACQAVVTLRGSEMTCDHITPRRGNKSKFNCLHHVSNLQILCSHCHTKKSEND